jgi:hypothetical protein
MVLKLAFLAAAPIGAIALTVLGHVELRVEPTPMARPVSALDFGNEITAYVVGGVVVIAALLAVALMARAVVQNHLVQED